MGEKKKFTFEILSHNKIIILSHPKYPISIFPLKKIFRLSCVGIYKYQIYFIARLNKDIIFINAFHLLHYIIQLFELLAERKIIVEVKPNILNIITTLVCNF